MRVNHLIRKGEGDSGGCGCGCIIAIGALLIIYFVAVVDGGSPSIKTAINVSIRPSLLNSSTGVLQLQNRNGQPLLVFLWIQNNDFNQKKSYSLTLEAHQTKEIGILETEWMFAPNESVKIWCIGYDSVTYNTFKTDDGKVGIKESWWDRPFRDFAKGS